MILIKNAIQCRKCGDEVESKHTHDFQRCSCGAVAVDGGLKYQRWVGEPDAFYDRSIVDGTVAE